MPSPLRKVAEQQLPEIDEEFVKAYGFESGDIEELRKDVVSRMEGERTTKIQADVKRQLMEGLLKQNPVDVPGVLVSQEAESLQKETMQRMGITDENQAPAADTFQETAEKRVRLGLLMSEILSQNEIELDDERVNAKVDEICAPYENPDEIRNIYLQNPQFMGQIQNMVLEEQVTDFLESHAKVGTKKLKFKELMELQAG